MLFVLNRDFQILGLASNDSEDTLHYYQDTLHTELVSGVSTYEFTVPKNHEDSQHIQEGNYVTFQNSKGKQLLFTIMEMEEDGQEKVVYCEDIGLDLLNETNAPLVSDIEQPVAWYIEQAIYDSGWEIGINEIAHLNRTLSFDSYTNALERILSILKAFDDAEVDFTVEFDGNAVAHQYINIHKRVGRDTGIRLNAGFELLEARRTVSMEGLVTSLRGIGKDIQNENPDLPDTPTDFSAIVYDDGRYYSNAGSAFVMDREANLKWSRFRNQQAQWDGYIVDIYEYDTDSPQELFNRTLSQLKKRNEPAITYEIAVNKIDADLSIGDTVTVVDSEFSPALYLQARVLSVNESDTDDSKNSIKLGNYVLLTSSIDAQLKELQTTLKEVRVSWFEQNQPILTIRSTNGEAFFDNAINTTINATITRGGIDTNSAYQESDFVWTKKDRLGNTVSGWSRTGKALAVTAADVIGKSLFICTVGGMSEQITIFNTETTIQSTTAPVSPVQGQRWIDTSVTPNIHKIYLSGQWKLVTPVSGEEFTEVKELANVNMQGIASVNTEVAKKVDTITYTSKVSAIESALANKLETAVANATKIAQDAEIAKKVAQTAYDSKVAELNTAIGTKLSTATANATKIAQDAAIATKVAQTAYDAKVVELNTAIETKLDTATATATKLAQDAEIAKKVAQTAYDAKVTELNAALATKLNTITANATNLAQDAEIAKRVAQTAYDAKVTELNAAIGTKLDTATATATKLAQDAEIAKKVAQTTYNTKVAAIESTLATKLNTAIADATKLAQDAEIAKKVALTTYNTKVGELDTAISGHTTRIEATETGLLAKASTVDVDALKTRMTTAETSLTTNANEIALKASQTDLDTVDSRLDTAESTLVVQAGQIASKVAQTTFDAANVRLGTAESTITQQATSIASKVATTTYNAGIAAKEDSIVKATTAPAHLNGKLWLNTSVTPNVLNRSTGTAWVKVTPTTAAEVGAYSSTDGSALGTRVTTAESTIVQQGNAIALKASQTDLNSATGRLTTAEGTLVVQAGQIASKVATTDFNAVESRLDTAESTITQQSGEIASKVATTTYNSGIASKEDSITKATVAPAHVNGRLWLDTSVTPNILNRSTGTAWVKITPTTASEVGAYSSTAGATLAGKVTTAESTIVQQGNAIALKASQADLNTATGRITTAESALTVQAGQIATKVAQTDFNAVEGRLDTAESSIVQQAGEIATKVAQSTFDTANTRLGTAESTISQQATLIASKVAQTDFDTAKGRLDTAEATLTVQAGQIATKVATATYTSGLALKEEAIVKATTAPAHLLGKLWLNTSVTPNALSRSNGTAWVKVTPTTASEVGAYSSTDGSTLAGRVTTAESTIVQSSNAIALKASQTDLNAIDGRLDTAEASLTVQAGQIASKVAQTAFDAANTRLTTAESTITQQATQIASKVAQSTFDAANTRLGTAESTITQQATQIASKVATTTYNAGIALKENSIVKTTTAPTHVNGLLWLNTSVTPNVLNRSTGTAWVKATPTTATEVGAYSGTDGSALATRVTTAESSITQQGNSIALKASQSDLDTATGRLTTAEGTLTVQAGQIASKVSQTDFNAANTRLGTAESSITQQAGEIATKVATTTYNTGIAAKEDTITKATTAPAHLNGRLWLNTSLTPNVLNRSTGTAWVKVTPTTATEVGAYSSSQGSALAARTTTAESTITQQGNAIALKASQADLETATGRLTTAEGTLVVQAGQIASKVEQTTFDAVNTRLGTAESSITQQATQIASKVAQADFNAVNTRLGTAESTITQQATQIASKVAQSTFDAANTRLGTAESTITQQATSIASKVATTTYNAGIAAKEDSITKATTAPAHLNGKLWLNTAVTPNVLNRSTGTAWVKVTPTTASEVGAYSTSEGSALGTRVTTAESTIIQQGNSIALKASQTDLDSAKTRLTTAEGTLTVQAGQIASKVAQTAFDAVNTRLGTAESTITQQATSIASKVSQTDFNAVNTRLGTAESSITQQAADITSKVATTTYNAGIATKENAVVKATTAPAHVSGLLWLNTAVTPNVLNRSTGTAWVKATPTTAAEVGAYSSTAGSTLAGRVTTAESTIVQQGNSIALKAAQTDLTAATGRLTTAEGTLVVQAGQIASKVAQTDFNAVNTRLGTAESSITQQATDITTKVATTTYNAGIALKEDSIIKATTAPAHLNGKLWLNTSVTPNVLNRSTGSAWVKVTPTTASEVGAYSTTEGSTLAGRVTTAESTIVQQGNSIALKATQTDLDAAKGRLTTAEGTLTVQAGQIASKVAQTDFNAVNTRLGTAESTIVQQATSIASKVAQADFNAVNTRLGTAESTIVQQATSIASKVATTTYNAGIAAKEDSIVKATTAPAHLSGKLWLNTSLTPNVLNRSTGSAWVKVTPTTAAEVGAYTSTDGSALAGRVTTAESTIVQQAGQITSKVAQTTYDTKVGQLDTAIGTKANASDLSALTTRVTSAETTISQSTTAINLRATKTEAQTYASTAQTAAISSAATDATSKADAALASAKTYTDGINLSLGARVTNAESAITADAITNTVMGTTTFNAKLAEYATEDLLSGYATTGALSSVKQTAESARDAVINLDFTPYAKNTQVQQLEDSINTNISQSGGVNLLRNSIGWNAADFWVNVSGTTETIQTPQLETFGYGSGWYKKHAMPASKITQTVSLPMAGTYTLSFRMNKSIETAVSGKASACGIYVDSLPFYGKGTGSGLTSGFEEFSYTFTTTKLTADISVVIGELAEATISGLMLNLGDKPFQWTSHSTEVYNTHVRMDINGIQVMGNRDGSKTVITPDEFSGYEDGEKIFTLNGDTTEVKKLKAEQQFEMAPITIVTIDNASYKGWAFI